MRMLVMLGVIATLLTVGSQAQGLVAGSKEAVQQATTQPAATPTASAAAGDSAIDQRLYSIETKLSRENKGTAFEELNRKLDDILRKLEKMERDIDDLEREVKRN